MNSVSLSALDIKSDSIEKTSLYNLDFLNQMSKGNDEFVNKMLAIFCKMAEENIELIHQGLKDFANRLIATITPDVSPGVKSVQQTTVTT